MNKHQEQLVEYLRDTAEYFAETIFTVQTEKFMVVDDVFPLISDFLEKSIRRDISNYTPKSEGYNRLVDMLIELKITKRDSPLVAQLSNVISAAYRN